MEPTPISKKSLTEDVTKGLKIDQLITKYNTKASEMRALLKAAGLKIKKTHVKRFVLIDDLGTAFPEGKALTTVETLNN